MKLNVYLSSAFKMVMLLSTRSGKRKENVGVQIGITGDDTDELLVFKFWDHNGD